MKRIPATLVVLLACGWVLASGDLQAQGRVGSAQVARPKVDNSPEAHARKMAELDAWLRRLVGKFRITISSMNSPVIMPCGVPGENPGGTCAIPDRINTSLLGQPIKGVGECWEIGAGPGVSCMFHFVTSNGELRPAAPRLMLYGLDPDTPGIRFLQVLSLGPSTATRGSLDGETVTFNVDCEQSPPLCTSRVLRIYAPSHRKYVEMTIRDRGSSPPGSRALSIPGGTRIELLPVGELPASP